MSNHLAFLPAPRQITYADGAYVLPVESLIVLDAACVSDLMPAARRVQGALAMIPGLDWQQSASPKVPAEKVGLRLTVAPERTPYPQGYRLHVTQQGITIEGHDPAGVFYGACTLAQMIAQAGQELPILEIHDWPDIPARGVMLDISRDRVYRMETLYELIDRLAGWKINQVQLYTEHTFAYQQHPEVWAKASPMTGEEILALDAYCRERFIELVPNQNSFGHMERWLKHPHYAEMAEIHGPFTPPWGGTMKGPFSLAPEHPGSIQLISSLYDELLPHFSSKLFNVGCDETFDLGQGASKAIVEERGKGEVYFDFLMKVYADVQRRGYTMQFWGDIINNHAPEKAAQLPRDVIALNWGYEADHPFDKENARFAASGVPFYVCPGTSSWNSIAGRTDNALGNLINAAENAVKYGAIGFLNTDWGDNGHWQVPPVSYLGFAAGAAYSWAVEANRSIDVPRVVSIFAFEDSTGSMGRVAYDLGNVYQVPGLHLSNSSALFWALRRPLNEPMRHELDPAKLRATLEAIDAAIAPLEENDMRRPDVELIEREFRSTARLLRHGAKRLLLAVEGDRDGLRDWLKQDLRDFMDEYQALWLERSRPGGLEDSLARFEEALKDY